MKDPKLRALPCGHLDRYAKEPRDAFKVRNGSWRPYACEVCKGWHLARVDRRKVAA